MKLKNRNKNNEKEYILHQKEFFKIKLLRDRSDKFHKIRKKVAEYAFNGKNVRALDICTGHGFQAIALKEVGCDKVIGTDVVPERIEYCKYLFPDSEVDFKIMDARELDFSDNYFDCTTVSAALHDMPTSAKKKVIREMVRVTKNRIVIFEPRIFKIPIFAVTYGLLGEFFDESLNFMEYARDSLDQILKDNHLEVIKNENACYGFMNIKVCELKQS